MMKKKEDLRVRKTKANLYKGLLKMLEQKSFEDIKIIDICNVSLINRSTFYDHFNDKYELLSSYLKDVSERLADNLVSSIQDKKYTSVKSYYLAIIKAHLDYLYNDVSRAASVKIIKNNLHSVASDMLVDFTLSIVINNLKENYVNESNMPIEVISSFYVNAATEVCLNYITDENFNQKELFSYLEQLIPELDYLKPLN